MKQTVISLVFMCLFSIPLFPEKVYFTTASPSLILREKPNRNSDKITNIPKFEKVILIEESNIEEKINGKNGKWVKIEWNTNKGWVFNSYLSEKLIDRNANLKDLIDQNFSAKNSLFFNGYFYEDNYKTNLASFQIKNSDDIYATYEAGGGSINLLKINYKNDSLTLTVRYLQTINNYDENKEPQIIRNEIFNCILSKNELIFYLEDSIPLSISCNKK